MAIRYGSNQGDLLYGTDENDELYGYQGNDFISAGRGNDVINGGLGADWMVGGAGNDWYYVDNVGDVVVENAGEGTYDVVYSTVSYMLSYNVEQLILQESGGAINGSGNEGNNSIFGNSYANVISGGDGHDNLYGGAGNDELRGGSGNDYIRGDAGDDIMIGGTGHDSYTVDSAGDYIIEFADEGLDTVYSTLSYTLGANLEELYLRGSAHISATGNELNNLLVGNAGNNVLNGGAGADRMVGGGGYDRYYVDNVGDTVVESANGGLDGVNSSVSYTLAANIESLLLIGDAAINGTGNELGNDLQGNSANNVLNGGGGNDTLYGGGGADILIGGTGADMFIFGYVNDSPLSSWVSVSDEIRDFSSSEGDRIYLEFMDARTDVSGNQAFSYVGDAAFSGTSGELRFENGLLRGDVDGDGDADFHIQVTNVSSLSINDFIL
jgi:Ca2+-binding RTX toxin-like protein